MGEVVIQISEKALFHKFAGKTLPRKNFPVYIYTWEESVAIRGSLKKLEKDIKAKDEDLDDFEKFWIVQKRAEDIYRMLVSAPPSHSTKTDDDGRFVFRNLKVGEKYLIIGATVEHGVGITLLPQVVDPLSPGENRIRLVDK